MELFCTGNNNVYVCYCYTEQRAPTVVHMCEFVIRFVHEIS